MALVPADGSMATWLGSGSGTTATSTTAGAGFWIPKAAVQAYVGSDAFVTDDIRDFLFSVLSKCADSYGTPKATTDTRPTKIVVTKTLDTVSNPKKAIFTVILEASTITVPPNTITLPSFG